MTPDPFPFICLDGDGRSPLTSVDKAVSRLRNDFWALAFGQGFVVGGSVQSVTHGVVTVEVK